MNSLWNLGTLVQIQSGIWSMEASLKPDDIGKSPSEIPDFVRLGFKRLFPKEAKNAFSSIANKARSTASRYGFDFFLTGAYFVPNGALEALRPVLETAQTDFNKVTDAFIYKYDNAKASFLNQYPDHRANLVPFYPNVEELRSKFYLNIYCYQIGSGATDLGAFGGITDDAYIDWATAAVNTLRTEAIDVASAISKAVEDGGLDGRNLRRVFTLVERLSKLDLMNDEKLAAAARAVASNASVKTATGLIKAAKAVPQASIRKLLLS